MACLPIATNMGSINSGSGFGSIIITNLNTGSGGGYDKDKKPNLTNGYDLGSLAGTNNSKFLFEILHSLFVLELRIFYF